LQFKTYIFNYIFQILISFDDFDGVSGLIQFMKENNVSFDHVTSKIFINSMKEKYYAYEKLNILFSDMKKVLNFSKQLNNY
jgi:hypothetical protein